MHKKFTPSGKKRSVILIILVSFLLLIVVVFLILPKLMLNYANKQLHDLREYTGNVRDLNMNFIDGLYVVKDFEMIKLDEDGKKDTTPFIKVSRIDIAIDWSALIKGKIATKVKVTNPVINYTKDLVKDKEITQDTMDLRQLADKLMPLSMNRFEIMNGQIHYVDIGRKPPVDVAIKDLYATATNLTNIVDKNKLLPSHINATANIYDGSFDLEIALNPLAKHPTFDMKTEAKGIHLNKLNELFENYGNFSVKKGTFSAYGEFAAKNGEFGGYVKPFIKDFEVKKYKEDDDLKQRIWEIIVGSTMKLLENPKTDAVATKIPVKGKFTNANADMWLAIHYVLRNAFVQALKPSVENSIDIKHIKPKDKETLLEKVFGGEKNKKEERRREKREERGESKE